MRARTARGFTLLEMVLVVAIIGILAAITVPIARNWMGKRHVMEAADLMMADIKTAGATSGTVGADVAFVAGATAITGAPTTGYMVFNGTKAVVTREITAPMTILLAPNFANPASISSGVGVVFFKDGAILGCLGYSANGGLRYNQGGTPTPGAGQIYVRNNDRTVKINITRQGTMTSTVQDGQDTTTPQNL